jgi:hypothetical protein
LAEPDHPRGGVAYDTAQRVKVGCARSTARRDHDVGAATDAEVGTQLGGYVFRPQHQRRRRSRRRSAARRASSAGCAGNGLSNEIKDRQIPTRRTR